MLPILTIPQCISAFADTFHGVFMHPAQRDHFAEMLTGVLVSGNKTIAGIQQGLTTGTSYDALRRFMSRSPWSVEDLRKQRLQVIKAATSGATGEEPCVACLDATFVHHVGEDIHGAYWYFDYAQRAHCLAQRLVLSTLAMPSKNLALGWKLYHRGYLKEQEDYLEEVMPAEDAAEEAWEEYDRLVQTFEANCDKHKTQPELAMELVDEIESQGIKNEAYVMDGALLTKELAAHIEEKTSCKAYVSKLAKSRLVQATDSHFQSLSSWAQSLPRDVFKPVHVKTRHGEPRTYWCFSKCITVQGWKKVRMVISFDNENLAGEPIFLVTNKTNWTQPEKIVQLYLYRDPIEHLIRDDKQELGFEHCQQRGQAAVEKHWELSFTAHTFLELAFQANLPEDVPSATIETIGQKRRLIECEVLQHFVELLVEFDERDRKELFDLIKRQRLNRIAR